MYYILGSSQAGHQLLLAIPGTIQRYTLYCNFYFKKNLAAPVIGVPRESN